MTEIITGFADILQHEAINFISDREARRRFKQYVYDTEHIKVDFRKPHWLKAYKDAMELAGFEFSKEGIEY